MPCKRCLAYATKGRDLFEMSMSILCTLVCVFHRSDAAFFHNDKTSKLDQLNHSLEVSINNVTASYRFRKPLTTGSK